MSAIALFATASTVLITLIAGSRMLYGMAYNKSLPLSLGKIHSKTKTPWIAIIGILITSVAFALIGDIVIVANITVFAVVITFAMINLSVIVLRYTEPDLERSFKVPVNIGRFPILPLFGFGVTVYMVIQFEMEVMLVGLAIVTAGALFYMIFNRKAPKKMRPFEDSNYDYGVIILLWSLGSALCKTKFDELPKKDSLEIPFL